MFDKDPLFELSPYFHSPHNIIPEHIDNRSIILDVGCNTGYLGRKLKEKGIISDGIDINKKALKEAKKIYRNVYWRDLYIPNLKLGNNKYDYIIFSDILEHLPRPDLLLKDTKQYLKKSGKVIASIPNIARLEIRLKLLFGKFNYSGGIMSQDHLRFFTKKSAIEMFENCGYQVVMIIPTGLGYILKIFLNLTAFQFIYICK